MSTTTNDISDIKQAANNVNVEKIEENLQDRNLIEEPESLTEKQKTPFIDEETRTDNS
ncbi:hypothetical protein [Psychrobacter sp. GP33]|uniref:hypothetical protein n=1 Tax=Psychrobacter sp. GP33 TaxID=2758709 RepID=UPI0015F8E701|nr:hypothetical protein [Psychrobacter sp. GP33]